MRRTAALMQDKDGRTLAVLDVIALGHGELKINGTVSEAGTVASMLLNGKRWPVVKAMSRTKQRDVVRLSFVHVYPGCTVDVAGFTWKREATDAQ